jgi:hypothetical protein
LPFGNPVYLDLTSSISYITAETIYIVQSPFRLFNYYTDVPGATFQDNIHTFFIGATGNIGLIILRSLILLPSNRLTSTLPLSLLIQPSLDQVGLPQRVTNCNPWSHPCSINILNTFSCIINNPDIINVNTHLSDNRPTLLV